MDDGTSWLEVQISWMSDFSKAYKWGILPSNGAFYWLNRDLRPGNLADSPDLLNQSGFSVF
ncbi:hypothetical protein GO755_19270 [Spirosoma sp. HMF4905]|uniref:Uncharacterized protein n=1 Tax=Spirosoma arboris TaxID=2682092 RepID=A0A7K1SEG3_9BACT|nr:hypothetical protein [Spirosoma arboris]MVM32197.1 hypothetical protein [Spirosoma arboris]